MVDFDRLKEISHSTSLLEVLEYYGIEYVNSGTDRYKCVCPFHNDHNPSMVIYTNENNKDESFCCYVDNIAGDPFHFIRTMEKGDFKQAWSVLCHINQIEDEEAKEVDIIDKIIRESSKIREDNRPSNLINYQISRLYFKLYEEFKNLLDLNLLMRLEAKIEDRLMKLDDYLSENPSYVEIQQYQKMEIQKVKEIQKQFKNNKGFSSDW